MHQNALSPAIINETFHISNHKKLTTAKSILLGIRLTAGVTIESKVVLGAGGKASEDVLCGKSLKAGSKSSRRHLALEGENVSRKTSNVGSSH